MRRFLLKILFLLPIPLIFLSTNFFVDPARLFKNGQNEKQIATLSLSGKNVTNISEYDERLVKKYYLEGLTSRRDVLVIGSSRLLSIGASQFQGQSFYNASVGNVSLEDLITFYWIYRKNNFGSAKIIVGVDPWLLNKNNGNKSYRSVVGDWRKAALNLSIPLNEKSQPVDIIPEKYIELFSISYFQSSLDKLEKVLSGDERSKKFSQTTNTIAQTSVLLTDGQVTFSKKLRSANVGQVREMASVFAHNDPVYGLGDFKELDSQFEKNFEKFIKFLKSNGNKIILYLPPYHPIAYQILVNDPKYKIILEAQEYYRKVANQEHIEVIGSYNPDTYNLLEQDFFDAMHLKDTGVQKIFDGKI